MQSIKSRNTTPELLVRCVLRSLGYHYRLHRGDLPGSPDIVFSSRRRVIFVHGCFWHSHDCRRGARVPKTNEPYWSGKVQRNARRDSEQQVALGLAGWKVLIIWECEIRDRSLLESKLSAFLENP